MEITGKDIRGIQIELIKDYLRRLDKKYRYFLFMTVSKEYSYF